MLLLKPAAKRQLMQKHCADARQSFKTLSLLISSHAHAAAADYAKAEDARGPGSGQNLVMKMKFIGGH